MYIKILSSYSVAHMKEYAVENGEKQRKLNNEKVMIQKSYFLIVIFFFYHRFNNLSGLLFIFLK